MNIYNLYILMCGYYSQIKSGFFFFNIYGAPVWMNFSSAPLIQLSLLCPHPILLPSSPLDPHLDAHILISSRTSLLLVAQVI